MDGVPVGLDADHAVVGEGGARVSDQTDGAQHVRHNHRLEHVELEVTVAPAHRHRHVVSHHWEQSHI